MSVTVMAVDPREVRAITTAARIQALLREQILSNRLEPGATVSEKDLCEAFRVSRTPVREALLRLAEEQLIDIFPQIGTFVSRIDMHAVRDAMVVRRALERVTAREAATKASAGDRARLEAVVRRQQEFDRTEANPDFYEADELFHQEIAAIAGHPNIWRVIKREKLQVDRVRFLTLPLPGRRRTVIAEHEAVLTAIAGGDPDGAEAAMMDHLAGVLPGSEVIERIHPDYFEPETAPSRPRAVARRGASATGEGENAR